MTQYILKREREKLLEFLKYMGGTVHYVVGYVN